MLKKDFIIIELSKKNIWLKKIIFFSIIIELFIGIIFYFNDNNNILKIAYISFILLWVIMNFISGFFISSYKQTGKLILGNNKISFNNNSVKLTDIQKITAYINNYQGEAHAGMYFGTGSAYPKEGINNFVILESKNKEIYKFQILFKYKKDMEIMYKIFYFYHNSGINTEFYKKDRKII